MNRDTRSARRRRGIIIPAAAALAVVPALAVAAAELVSSPADGPPPTPTALSDSSADGADAPAAPEPPTETSEPAAPEPPTETSEPPAAEPLTEAEPTSISIPSIDVDADVLELGLHDDGTMEVPPHAPQPDSDTGWYTHSPSPGSLGPSVITGHVDSERDGPAVFHQLGSLSEGDTVEVSRDDDVTAVFEIQHAEQYGKDEFPTYTVYGDIDHAGLRLITCGGDFDSDRLEYEDNIVVYAELVSSHPTQ